MINFTTLVKPVLQEWGTECGEGGEWRECYNVIFPGMSPNIPGNVLKHFIFLLLFTLF